MNIHIMRRRGLGMQSCKGLSLSLTEMETTTSFGTGMTGTPDWLIRWGTRARTQGIPLDKQINKSSAIGLCSNKLEMRKVLVECGGLTMETLFNVTTMLPTQAETKYVLRPARHAQGKNLFVLQGDSLGGMISSKPDLFADGWYATKYVEKVAEYRVFVVSGRVVAVAEKTPDDPDAVAWNMSQGATVGNVRWGDWNLNVCDVAIKAHNLSGLDFSGVDVIIDDEGKAYVLELNSAPTIMMKSDGTHSYRHECLAKGIKYIIDNDFPVLEVPEDISNWRDVIHPAIWSR